MANAAVLNFTLTTRHFLQAQKYDVPLSQVYKEDTLLQLHIK
jgi:hypothetical protein